MSAIACFGSIAVVQTNSSPLSPFGRFADMQPGECPLLPIPAIQLAWNCRNRTAAIGQKRTLARGQESDLFGAPDPKSLPRSLWQRYLLTTYKPISEKVIVLPCILVDTLVQFRVLFRQLNIKRLRDNVQYVGACAVPVARNIHADKIRDAEES